MSDDEVLDALKQSLSGVRMERPVEVIERRGRARRRGRKLLGLAAGGGVAVVAALALALPTTTNRPGTFPDGGPSLTPAAFSLVKQQDQTVKLTLNYEQILDPVALEDALADAGIPAVVKTQAYCFPKKKELPSTSKVFRTAEVTGPDGSAKETALVIDPAKMPKHSVIYFSIFKLSPDDKVGKVSRVLVADDDPMVCREFRR
ncbi:hypothetical protein AB0J82_03555 [Asanoa sp. NPDC049518]|uniref:hypothetical protein n=1 Tax=unclassified Asanoa TaxID=2685164 RepID=UPI0034290A69